MPITQDRLISIVEIADKANQNLKLAPKIAREKRDGLADFLRNELRCAELIRASADENLTRIMTTILREIESTWEYLINNLDELQPSTEDLERIYEEKLHYKYTRAKNDWSRDYMGRKRNAEKRETKNPSTPPAAEDPEASLAYEAWKRSQKPSGKPNDSKTNISGRTDAEIAQRDEERKSRDRLENELGLALPINTK